MNRSSINPDKRLPATTRASPTPYQRGSPSGRSVGLSTPTTRLAQSNGARRAQDSLLRSTSSGELGTQAVFSERRPVEAPRQSNAELIRTLRSCMEETRTIALQQDGLRAYTHKLEEEIRMLNQELDIANAKLEEKKGAEELNLRLQARILNLERMKPDAEKTEPSGQPDSFELEEMRKQYRILEDHYHELLDYVRGVEDKDAYDNRRSPRYSDD